MILAQPEFCVEGTNLVTRNGLQKCLTNGTLPSEDPATQSVDKLCQVYDQFPASGEGGVDAQTLAQALNLVLHGSMADKILFVLSAMCIENDGMTRTQTQQALQFAANIFSRTTTLHLEDEQIEAAVNRVFKRVRQQRKQKKSEAQLSVKAFQDFCNYDQFVLAHCFGHQQMAADLSRQRMHTGALSAPLDNLDNSQSARPQRTRSFNSTKSPRPYT